MRCTRCDGLAVPQAVGIDPQGKVVFGWCLQCLEDRGCTLVETTPAGRWRFSRRSGGILDPAIRIRPPRPCDPASESDQSRWIVGIVAVLLMSWGLVLLVAGIWSLARSEAASSPLGNGTPPVLIGGGSATALLGAALVVLAARRNAYPGTFLLAPMSWFSFLLGLGILLHRIVTSAPQRSLPALLGALVCLGVSALTWKIYHSQRRQTAAPGPRRSSKSGAPTSRSRAAGRRPR